MQFTGPSLPVHQSMSVPWEFVTSSHFISQLPPTRFPLITDIRMCYFLPVHHSEWHFWPGRRSKYHTVFTFLFCIYVIFIQYTSSIYFLFFCIFFVVPKRLPQFPSMIVLLLIHQIHQNAWFLSKRWKVM